MASEASSSAVWGHAVNLALHAAVSSPVLDNNFIDERNNNKNNNASGGGGGGKAFAFRATPSKVVVGHFPNNRFNPHHHHHLLSSASSAAAAACHELEPRVFNLPERHVVSCLALHRDTSHHSLRNWIAIGTQDQGCFVFPLESEKKGERYGDAPTPLDTSSTATVGVNVEVGENNNISSSEMFTLDYKWVAKSTGGSVLAAAFIPSTAQSPMLLALATAAATNATTATTAAGPTGGGVAAFSIHLSIWGVEGSARRQLLWKSTPLLDVALHDVQSLQCCPFHLGSSAAKQQPGSAAATTLALCTRRGGVSLWRVHISAAAPRAAAAVSPTSRASPMSPGATTSAAAAISLDVKQRVCASIPELKGAEFVSLAIPTPLHNKQQSTPTAAAATTSPQSEVVFALTTSPKEQTMLEVLPPHHFTYLTFHTGRSSNSTCLRVH
ncbi:Hypothetical protein, putative [Bodo saltans]|uniref:Uncharacterized protein n=1 Tax=Bodo saltans TaxID=75058 RepID=A0A0S4IJR4_BODSA|nr:Hypothetical protein, putative [Bodo saltans]|eukprot:CUE91995.1 Hypothetical protein, putative [Bodo saltans]